MRSLAYTRLSRPRFLGLRDDHSVGRDRLPARIGDDDPARWLGDRALRRAPVMPLDHGRRLAELIPHAHLVEIPDAHTLIPLDQPARLADLIREFVRDTGRPPQ